MSALPHGNSAAACKPPGVGNSHQCSTQSVPHLLLTLKNAQRRSWFGLASLKPACTAMTSNCRSLLRYSACQKVQTGTPKPQKGTLGFVPKSTHLLWLLWSVISLALLSLVPARLLRMHGLAIPHPPTCLNLSLAQWRSTLTLPNKRFAHICLMLFNVIFNPNSKHPNVHKPQLNAAEHKLHWSPSPLASKRRARTAWHKAFTWERL